MTHRIAILAFILWSILGGVSSAKAQDLAFCFLPLSKGVLKAHASFNEIYEFDVTQDGIPHNVKSVSAMFTKLEDASSCITQWKLKEAAMKHLVVIFEWQHGVGWIKQSVSGPGVNLTIRVNGERCPYCSTSITEDRSVESGADQHVSGAFFHS